MLKPWQVTSANHLLSVIRTHGSAADLSSTGTGKTFTALAVAQALQLPTLIVCPEIAVTAWNLAAEEHFNERFSVINYERIRLGETGFGTWSNQGAMRAKRSPVFVCSRCLRRYNSPKDFDACPYSPLGVHCVDCKSPRPPRLGEFYFRPGVKFLVFDEAHRCGGGDSLNAELLIAAKRQKIPHLMLSATLAENPLKLRAIGYSLGLHNDGHDEVLANGRRGLRAYRAWLGSNSCRRDPRFKGFKWFAGAEEQRSIMSGIRAQIIPERGVRVRCEEIPGFPEQVISADLIDLEPTDTAALKELYEQLEGSLEITKILRLRQEIEMRKIPAIVEVARDRMEQGFSIGTFLNFRDSLEELSRLLGCPYIDGTITGKKRDEIIAGYQRNDFTCLGLNSDAASLAINLQDLDGQHPRFGIVSPPWSAVCFRQLTGRFRREGGRSTSYFKTLFAAGTVEVKMWRALRGKLNCLDSLNDNDLQPNNLHMA